jgi:hypothetical protein
MISSTAFTPAAIVELKMSVSSPRYVSSLGSCAAGVLNDTVTGLKSQIAWYSILFVHSIFITHSLFIYPVFSAGGGIAEICYIGTWV